MNPQDVQIPKGMILTLAGKDVKAKIEAWCDILNFKEPEDVLNLGGQYTVSYRVCTFNGEPKTVKRGFHSKTYADYFVALLQTKGAAIVSGPDFNVQLVDPRVNGMRLVNAYGSIEEAVRGIV